MRRNAANVVPFPGSLPEKIAVQSPEGELLCWVDDEAARTMLKARQVTIRRQGGRIRVLVATERMDYTALKAGRGDAFSQTRYSHNHETNDNPEKVWTLKRLPAWSSRVFLEVAADCGGMSQVWECAICGRRVSTAVAGRDREHPATTPLQIEMPAGWTIEKRAPVCDHHTRVIAMPVPKPKRKRKPKTYRIAA